MRRRHVKRTETPPDPRYNNRLVQKMINMFMFDGKKSVSERVVYDAFDILKTSAGTNDVLTVFHKAIENVRPHVELKARRVGGATYQIPIEVRHDVFTSDVLENRLLLAALAAMGRLPSRSEAKRAEANRAFAHYRW